MANGALGANGTVRATVDRFFSVQSSRRSLFRDLQPRNHWSKLPNLNGGAGWDDALWGQVNATSVDWVGRLSVQSSLGTTNRNEGTRGAPGNIFMTADMNGDNRDDLVYGRITSSNAVEWWVALASGSRFNTATRWTSDSGAPGAIYRLGDITGDGRADLFFGEPTSANTVRWRMRASTGSGFGTTTTLINDAGNRDHIFLAGDVTGDGQTDLVVKKGGGTEVYESTGTALQLARRDTIINFNPDYILLQDVSGDGRADLVTGHVTSDTAIKIKVRRSNGCGSSQCFRSVQTWLNDGGNAGDNLRLGDGNGDGDFDLFAIRPNGLTSLTATPNLAAVRWFRAQSTGTGFNTGTTWSSDASDDGQLIP